MTPAFRPIGNLLPPRWLLANTGIVLKSKPNSRARVLALRKELEEAILHTAHTWTHAKWHALARRVNHFQLKANLVYRDWCRAGSPTTLPPGRGMVRSRWIASLPLIAFKEARVISLNGRPSQFRFESSGTTSLGRRVVSRHELRDLDLYHASVVSGWKWFLETRAKVLGKNQRRKIVPARFPVGETDFLALMPSQQEASHSSLSTMLQILMETYGRDRDLWCMSKGTWKWNALVSRLREIERTPHPTVLFGTAFGWVHFLDWCAERQLSFHLPANCLAFETGGYKGRSRELSRSELHRSLQTLLGLGADQVGSEYSMCEISSQAWSFNVQRGNRTLTIFRFPPWCHHRVMQAGSSLPVRAGDPGVLEIHDLANFDSCAFVRTEDRVIAHGDGFELLGRLPQAGLKGCSLAFE